MSASDQPRPVPRTSDAGPMGFWDQADAQSVLVVDDEAATREVLSRWLQRFGYAVTTASSADEALRLMNERPSAVVLCDVRMPDRDGLWLLARLRDQFPTTGVIMATGAAEVGPAITSLRRGVIDYLTKPFTPDHLRDAVRRGMDWHLNVSSERRWAQQLVREADEREEQLRVAIAALAITSDESVNELLALATRGQEAAYAHARRVASLSVLLCDRMGRPDREKRIIRRAALLHDVGKCAVPVAVIEKPAPLTPEEYELVRTHPVRAHRLLSPFPYLAEAAAILRGAHERPDGKGFPDGVAAPRIPLGSAIVSIANTYDAMTTACAYRDPIPPGEALLELERGAGTQFDPSLVPLFVDLLRTV